MLNHLKLSLKNKQCFMCKNFKGDLSGKGGALDVPEKCTLLKVSQPFNWVEYYANNTRENVYTRENTLKLEVNV